MWQQPSAPWVGYSWIAGREFCMLRCMHDMSLCIRYLDVIFHYSHKNKSFMSLTNSQRNFKFKQYNKS